MTLELTHGLPGMAADGLPEPPGFAPHRRAAITRLSPKDCVSHRRSFAARCARTRRLSNAIFSQRPRRQSPRECTGHSRHDDLPLFPCLAATFWGRWIGVQGAMDGGPRGFHLRCQSLAEGAGRLAQFLGLLTQGTQRRNMRRLVGKPRPLDAQAQGLSTVHTKPRGPLICTWLKRGNQTGAGRPDRVRLPGVRDGSDGGRANCRSGLLHLQSLRSPLD